MGKEHRPEPGKSTRVDAMQGANATPGKSPSTGSPSASTPAATSDSSKPDRAVPYLERVRSTAPSGDGAAPTEPGGVVSDPTGVKRAVPRLELGAKSPQGEHAETPQRDAANVEAPRIAPLTGAREALNAKVDRELATAARIGAPITATGYLHLHMPEALRGARAFVASRQLASGDAQVTLSEDFYEHLFAAFRDGDTAAGVTRLRNWIAPEDLLAIVDRNRPLYEADAEQPNAPNAALDYGHGGKGPAAWSPSVAIGLGSSLEVRLRESLPRMSQRLVAVTAKKRAAAKAAGKEPDPIRPEELVPSHKLDWAIARAMVAFGTVGASVKEGTLAVRDDINTTYRKVRVEWNKTAHAVRAIDPIDATVEEVAAAVLKTPTEAYRIRRVGDLFVIPKDSDVARGAGETQADAAHLAFGPDAARIEAVEVERAMKNDVEAKAPAGASFATLQAAWTRVNEQLTGLSIVVREYGLDVHLIAAVERHKAHRLDLATLSGKDAIVRAELFARQEQLLTSIAADIGSIVSESKMRVASGKGGSDKSPKGATNARASADATRMALLKLVNAAGLAHLPETGAAVFAEAHAARRDTMLVTFETLLGDIATQIEIARLTMAHSLARAANSKAVFKTSLQDRADALRARLAALRSKLLAGTADSAEVEALYAAIDALRFEASVIASIGQLGDAFETLDKLEDTGWVVFSEWFTNNNLLDAAQHKDTNRLEQSRQTAFALRGDLQTVHSKWLKVQAQANTLAEQLTAGGVSDPHDKALALVGPQLALIQGDLAKIGGQAKIREFLTEAYDKVKSAERRAMILKVAAMIGFAIVSSGVGTLAEGGVVGLVGPGIAASAVGVIVETTTFTLLNAALSEDSLAHSFVSNFVGNLATFAALRGVSKALSGTAIGKTLAAVAGGERVALLSRLAAKAGSITASTLVVVGVQFAQAQYESLLATGKTMSLDELKMAGLQGMAMMIGAAIAHKMLGESMQEMKALGMRGGAYVKRQVRMKQLSEAVMASGNPATAIELLHETREALDAKGEAIEALGEMSDKELEANGLSRATVKALAHDQKANVAALDNLETGTMNAQLGLDTVVPGQVYAGDAAAIAPVLDSYRARPGYRIEREGTGYHVVGRDGTAFHILERAGANEGRANGATSGRSVAGETPAAGTPSTGETGGRTGAAEGTQDGHRSSARSGADQLDAAMASPPVLDQVEIATGVQKGPAYERDMADLRQFYADMEAEGQQGVVTKGAAKDGNYQWNYGHKAFTFSHGLVTFEVTVFLDSSRITPSELQKLKKQVHAGVDHHYNQKKLKVRGPDGIERQLHVEVLFVDDIGSSDIQVIALPGNGAANLNRWYVDGNPTTHAHEVTHGAFGTTDEYVDDSGAAPNRATPKSPGVYQETPPGIMSNYWVGHPIKDNTAHPGTEVKQRNLDEVSKFVPKEPSRRQEPTTSGPEPSAGRPASEGPQPVTGERAPAKSQSESPSSAARVGGEGAATTPAAPNSSESPAALPKTKVEKEVDRTLASKLALILPAGARQTNPRENPFEIEIAHGNVSTRVLIRVSEVASSTEVKRVGDHIEVSIPASSSDIGLELATAMSRAQVLAVGAGPKTAHGEHVVRTRYLLAELDAASALPGRNDPKRVDQTSARVRAALNDAGVATKEDAQRVFGDDPQLRRRVDLFLDGVVDRPNPGNSTNLETYGIASEAHLQGMRSRVAGEGTDQLIATERAALRGQLRLEGARRVFEPLDEEAFRNGLSREQGFEVDRIADDMLRTINDANLTPQQRAGRLGGQVTSLESLGLGGDRVARMRAAVAQFVGGDSAGHGMVLDVETGTLTGMEAEGRAAAPRSIRQLWTEVDQANQKAREQGIGINYAIVMHDPQPDVNGRSKATVEVVSRPAPRYRMDRPASSGRGVESVGNKPGELTVDVGVGRGAFAAEAVPESDRAGMIVQTDVVANAEKAQQHRYVAGTADAGPSGSSGAVVVFADVLKHPELMKPGPGDRPDAGTKRMFLNNVSAHYDQNLPPGTRWTGPEYQTLARGLAESMPQDATVDISWDMSPEKEGGAPGSRGHITGPELLRALQATGREVHLEQATANVEGEGAVPRDKRPIQPVDAEYTLDAGRSSSPDPSKLRGFVPPTPTNRWVIKFGPPLANGSKHQ